MKRQQWFFSILLILTLIAAGCGLEVNARNAPDADRRNLNVIEVDPAVSDAQSILYESEHYFESFWMSLKVSLHAIPHFLLPSGTFLCNKV